jgi:cyclophilin family peptidyl-prolyl cis-trans isomerase
MGWVTLELAGPDDMPHTVYNFLEQVDRGMYGSGEFGFEFNGPHITMAGPLSEGLNNVFESSGLSHVLFQEYSPNFSHVPYTIGLTGRPSGPKLYFNTQDNSIAHGPGGYANDGLADPCFGRITRGWEYIDRVHSSTGALNPGDWKRIENQIAILSIRRL